MDFVEIPVTESQGDPCQPENWIISDRGNWKCLNQLHRKPSLDLLEEKPNGLWLEKLQPTDRVSHEWLMKTPPRHSVCCIRTEKLRLLFYTNAWGKPCRRAGFACHSIQYDLALTNPIITDKYCPHVPGAGQPMKDFRLVNCLICVSLAGEFNGYHYKVVATVFEQDE